jgi:hypothetical protein
LVNAIYQPTTGLWTAHITACATGQGLGSCLKWYQIAPATIKVIQDAVFDFSNAYVFAPWMVVNASGDTVIPFEISGQIFTQRLTT